MLRHWHGECDHPHTAAELGKMMVGKLSGGECQYWRIPYAGTIRTA